MTDYKKPELLAPAGNRDAVAAAVQAGADAVYLGGKDFSARAFADNFSNDDIEWATEYCHLRKVKVYIAVNTLVADREFERLAGFIAFVNNIGADAIIVQDFGVARLAREIAPELSLHASTQAFVYDSDGAEYAGQLGFKRVVAARELSFDKIKEIVTNTSIEIEMFVHGALCICYSGQCLMSSMIGGRSANRGKCAQPCRLLYKVCGKERYNLSPKDLCLIKHLDSIKKSGVSALKIEGRMKGAAYVSTVTAIYRKYLDGQDKVSQADYEKLERIFYRGGFTDGYFTGKKGAHMICPDKPENPYEKQCGTETVVCRDVKNPVQINCIARLGAPLSVQMTDSLGNSIVCKGKIPVQRAQKKALTHEHLKTRLSKLGDTVFVAESITIDSDDNIFLPVSELNCVRRDAAQLLQQCITSSYRRDSAKDFKINTLSRAKVQALQTAAQISTKEQLEAVEECDFLYIPLDLVLKQNYENKKIIAVLPRISGDDLYYKLRELPVKKALMTNIGQYSILQKLNFDIYIDYNLNVFNTMAADHFSYAKRITVSAELMLSQIRGIAAQVPLEAVAYGRLPLMLTENCIIKSGKSCGAANGISDRTGVTFPVRCLPECRNEILNSKPVVMSDKLEDIKNSGIDAVRLLFTIETPKECAEVLEWYKKGIRPDIDFTRGKFYKGV